MLRATLLQPLTDSETLEIRYDCVEELRDEQDMAANVGQVCLCV